MNTFQIGIPFNARSIRSLGGEDFFDDFFSNFPQRGYTGGPSEMIRPGSLYADRIKEAFQEMGPSEINEIIDESVDEVTLDFTDEEDLKKVDDLLKKYDDKQMEKAVDKLSEDLHGKPMKDPSPAAPKKTAGNRAKDMLGKVKSIDPKDVVKGLLKASPAMVAEVLAFEGGKMGGQALSDKIFEPMPGPGGPIEGLLPSFLSYIDPTAGGSTPYVPNPYEVTRTTKSGKAEPGDPGFDDQMAVDMLMRLLPDAFGRGSFVGVEPGNEKPFQARSAGRR